MKLRRMKTKKIGRMGKTAKRIRGWLTKDDIELLEEASKRVLKYPKNPAKKYGCGDCNYTWLYSSMKCPVCASQNTKNVEA